MDDTQDTLVSDLDLLAECVATDSDVQSVWQCADQVLARQVGHRLFTVLLFDPATDELVRAYSNQPKEYPTSGRKKMLTTSWGDLVLKQGKSFIGNDAEAIRWAFYDHDTIFGMGLESVLNMPIRRAGQTIGALNLLHVAGFYREDQLRAARLVAGLLSPICH